MHVTVLSLRLTSSSADRRQAAACEGCERLKKVACSPDAQMDTQINVLAKTFIDSADYFWSTNLGENISSKLKKRFSVFVATTAVACKQMEAEITPKIGFQLILQWIFEFLPLFYIKS